MLYSSYCLKSSNCYVACLFLSLGFEGYLVTDEVFFVDFFLTLLFEGLRTDYWDLGEALSASVENYVGVGIDSSSEYEIFTSSLAYYSRAFIFS